MQNSKTDLKRQARYVVQKLRKEYPDAHCALNYSNPVELLIATVLSAQCTDERVNKVTEIFFNKYQAPEEVAKLNVKDIEKEVKSTGFFRNKAKNIKSLCEILVRDYESNLPDRLDDLVKLPGVGRKTANVVLGEIFNKPEGIVVDTHVKRLSNRLGLTQSQNPVIIERDLMEILPKKNWVEFPHLMIAHGRAKCKAPKPKCTHCTMQKKCYYFKKNEGVE